MILCWVGDLFKLRGNYFLLRRYFMHCEGFFFCGGRILLHWGGNYFCWGEILCIREIIFCGGRILLHWGGNHFCWGEIFLHWGENIVFEGFFCVFFIEGLVVFCWGWFLHWGSKSHDLRNPKLSCIRFLSLCTSTYSSKRSVKQHVVDTKNVHQCASKLNDSVYRQFFSGVYVTLNPCLLYHANWTWNMKSPTTFPLSFLKGSMLRKLNGL